LEPVIDERDSAAKNQEHGGGDGGKLEKNTGCGRRA
jgi:hypothetical protein